MLNLQVLINLIFITMNLQVLNLVFSDFRRSANWKVLPLQTHFLLDCEVRSFDLHPGKGEIKHHTKLGGHKEWTSFFSIFGKISYKSVFMSSGKAMAESCENTIMLIWTANNSKPLHQAKL